MQEITRRAVLRQAAAATALSYGRVWGANERVRTALVGFSDRAKAVLIPAFLANAKAHSFELAAVSDIWKLRREEGAAHVGKLTGASVATARNNDELYARKDIDAVIISTADFQHAQHGMEAVRAGCDAYIEKPLANRMVDARNLRDAVQETRRIVQVGTQRRSSSSAAALRDFIQSGQFGELSMVRLTAHANEPARWRRPALVAALRSEDTDWGRFRMDRTTEPFDARKYIEYRLFWPYSSGIFDQWMIHQIDALQMITGLARPRSVVASGGVYRFRDGRTNADTVLAAFDYGRFLAEFSGRMANSAGGTEDTYYSERGTLVASSGKVTAEGGLTEKAAAKAGMKAALAEELTLTRRAGQDELRAEDTVSAHMRNWMECVRTRKSPVAGMDAGYSQSIALCMAIAALHTGRRATFNEKTQEVECT